MASHTPNQVANLYGVTDTTVRNWIKRGALGALVRKIGRRSAIRITDMHLTEFEKRTGATRFVDGHGQRSTYKRYNSEAARKAPKVEGEYKLHRA